LASLDQVLLELNRYDAEHYWYIASYQVQPSCAGIAEGVPVRK
jgi:hypothetical protein